MDEMVDRSGNENVFSRNDLEAKIHRIGMKPDYIEKTSSNIKCGQFKYFVLQMGACNAA